MLYPLRAVHLKINVLSFAAHHFLVYPNDSTSGVVRYEVLFTWFVCDYLVFERVLLYTYDQFAERDCVRVPWRIAPKIYYSPIAIIPQKSLYVISDLDTEFQCVAFSSALRFIQPTCIQKSNRH